MMKWIINGASGRMGQALQQLMGEGFRDTQAAALVDPRLPTDLDACSFSRLRDFTGEADGIIDFTNHSVTGELMDYAVSRHLPVVVATTGHTEEELAYIRECAREIPVFLSANMSLGIAFLAETARKAAEMFPDAEVEIVEAHHDKKLDVPSGTALMLAESVREARPGAPFVVGRHMQGLRSREEIGIHSLRMGNVVGQHEVIIATGSQIITLKHEAQSRTLFAEGALSAACFLVGKKAGLYTMRDLVNGD